MKVRAIYIRVDMFTGFQIYFFHLECYDRLPRGYLSQTPGCPDTCHDLIWINGGFGDYSPCKEGVWRTFGAEGGIYCGNDNALVKWFCRKSCGHCTSKETHFYILF